MKTDIKLVVFDMAGTTVRDDDAVNRCLQSAMSDGGIQVTRDEINAVMGLPKPEAIALLYAQRFGSEAPANVVRDLHEDFKRRMIEFYRTSPNVGEMPGAMDLFRLLREKGILVALDTGFNRGIVNAVLDRLEWSCPELLDATVTSDEVPRGRPHPDMVFEAMRRLGIEDVRQVAKVGDTPSDLQEGTAAGCQFVVGVTNGTHTQKQLESYPHTHLIAHLGALPEVLTSANGNSVTMPTASPDQSELMARTEFENPYILLTPGPLSTSPTVRTAMLRDWCTWDDDYNVGIVTPLRRSLVQIASETRPDLFTAVLMQGSGTFSVEAMIGSTIPENGKLLVLANGAYGQRLGQIASVLKIPTIIHDSGEVAPPDLEKLEATLATDESITHVACVHLETTTGMLNPLENIAGIVKQHRKILLVDAMSSFGGMQFDMESLGIDFLVASSNKCLQGTPGFGFVICRREELARCKERARSLSLDLYSQWETMELERGKWRYTSPTHIVRALAQAIAELEKEGGVAARHARYRENHRRLVQGMTRLGFECLLPQELQSLVITAFHSLAHPNFSFLEFYQELKQRGFVIYPGKIAKADSFRIGTIGHVFPNDIDHLIAAVDEFVFLTLNRNGKNGSKEKK